jgi:hypothetical protein
MCHHARQARIMKTETEGPLVKKVKLARRVLEIGHLSTLARVVFAELLLGFHNTRDGQCNPKATVLAARVGRDEKRVRLALHELVQCGELTAKRRRGASSFGFPDLEDRAKTPGLIGTERAFIPGLGQVKTPALERAKSAALNKENLNQQIEPKERSTDGTRGQATARIITGGDRGRYEMEIANRIAADGTDGLNILGGLPLEELDQLCAQQRRGTLSDRTIEELRRTGGMSGRGAGRSPRRLSARTPLCLSEVKASTRCRTALQIAVPMSSPFELNQKNQKNQKAAVT